MTYSIIKYENREKIKNKIVSKICQLGNCVSLTLSRQK